MDGFLEVGMYTARLLKGTKLADLPVAQMNSFDLVFNLKAAKALGLTVPSSMLAISTEIIE